jgi:flagellar motor switch protein FliM
MDTERTFEERISSIDMGAANLFSRRELEILGPLHQRAAQKVTSNLSASLRFSVELKLSDLRQSTFVDWWKTIDPMACLFPFGGEVGSANALLTMAPQVGFGLLEVILGGEPRAETPARALTDVEHTLLLDAARIMRKDWESSWATYAPVSFPNELHEVTEQQLENMYSGDNLLIAVFSTTIGPATGDVTFVFPARMVRDAKRTDESKRRMPHVSENPERENRMLKRIEDCSLSIHARVDGMRDKLTVLRQLKPGDVICLNLPLDSVIQGRVNGTPRFLGEIVTVGRKRGLLVHDFQGVDDDGGTVNR